MCVYTHMFILLQVSIHIHIINITVSKKESGDLRTAFKARKCILLLDLSTKEASNTDLTQSTANSKRTKNVYELKKNP
jgi:hypothetical protein